MKEKVMTIEEAERNAIMLALHHFSGNRSHSARALGMALRTLRHRIARYRKQGFDIPESKFGNNWRGSSEARAASVSGALQDGGSIPSPSTYSVIGEEP